MKKFFIIFLVFISCPCLAQSFEQNKIIFNKIKGSRASLASSTNNGQLDLFFNNGDSLVQVGLNDSAFKTIYMPAEEHVWVDLNYDNYLDIVASGKDNFGFYINLKNGLLSEYTLIDTIGLKNLAALDIDLNGRIEIFGIDNGTLTNYTQNGEEWNKLTFDSSGHVEWYNFFDYNNDGRRDISYKLDSALYIIQNQRLIDSFFLSDTLEFTSVEAVFDIDGDGKNDYLIHDNSLELKLSNKEDISLDSLRFTSISSAFLADFNSNGSVDIAIAGVIDSSYQVKLILSTDSTYRSETFQSDTTIVSMEIGDVDYDGDLDFVTLTLSGVNYFKNVTKEINSFPSSNTNPTAFPTLNGVYIFYDSMEDESTPGKSLTYDISLYRIDGDQVLLNPLFDIENQNRLKSETGNAGRSTKAYFPDIEPGFYHYQIQAIDNALYGGTSCTGAYMVCEEYTISYVKACKGDSLTFEGGNNSKGRWFSANRKQIIGTEDPFLQMTAIREDTIYYAPTNAAACLDYRIWIIDLEKEYSLADTIITCKDEPIELATFQYDSIRWTSLYTGQTNVSDSLSYVASEEDLLFVQLFVQDAKCPLQDSVIIIPVKPDVTVDKEYIKLKFPQGVQLLASGALHYLWSPEEGLESPSKYNPIAHPETNTEYKVIGTDSLGCTDTASVIIEIDYRTFIPNLFTPNGDGNNDLLRILNLTHVQELEFGIYNRNGEQIYSTNNIIEVQAKGWDGTINGSVQPEGVYYWRIKGKHSNGQPLRLNGKEKGEIILMR